MFGMMAIVFLLIGCSYCNKYVGLQDDHVVEELAERVIKSELGVDIDLTPSSAE
jgi:hypothetical protein